MKEDNKEKLIKEILTELYASDGSLREKEEDLKSAIDKIISLKPVPEIDEDFRKRLRAEISERILLMQKGRKASLKFGLADIFSFPQLSYALVGSLITLLAIIPSFYYVNQRENSGQKTGITAETNISLTQTSKQAFGTIGEESALTQTEGLGGGGGEASSFAQTPDTSRSAGNYTYVYKGDEVILNEREIDVLEKEKRWKTSTGLINILSDMNFSLMDLSGFQSTKLNMISFSEDKEFGYNVYIDLKNSSISIDRNYEKWPQPPMPECFGKECSVPAGSGAVIEPSEAVSIADNFMREHRINLEAYAGPEILQRNVSGSTGEPDYSLESAQVIYPLVINGLEVYDAGGNKTGIIVNVDIREKRVAGVYNITSHRYLSSAYPAETDFSKITGRIGQSASVFPMREAAGKPSEIVLGTPEKVYLREWRTTTSEPEEMLIPALSFPIIEIPEGIIYPQGRIIVSLLAE